MELTFERVLLGHLEVLSRAQQMEPGSDRQPPLVWRWVQRPGAALRCRSRGRVETMKSHLLTDSPLVKHLYSRSDKQDAPPHTFHTAGTHSQHHGRDAVSVVPRTVEGRVKQLSSPFR